MRLLEIASEKINFLNKYSDITIKNYIDYKKDFIVILVDYKILN